HRASPSRYSLCMGHRQRPPQLVRSAGPMSMRAVGLTEASRGAAYARPRVGVRTLARSALQALKAPQSPDRCASFRRSQLPADRPFPAASDLGPQRILDRVGVIYREITIRLRKGPQRAAAAPSIDQALDGDRDGMVIDAASPARKVFCLRNT